MLTQRFIEAFELAATLHARQRRKGTAIPYLAHVMAVASIALEHGADEDQAIAALLHDAVEDQGGPPTLERIRQAFGDEVARLVEACTDTQFGEKDNWRQRKEGYLAHLALADEAVRLVSASDKLHNARSILTDLRANGEATWERFKGGKDGSLWYYRALANIFLGAGPGSIAGELDIVVAEIQRLANEGNTK